AQPLGPRRSAFRRLGVSVCRKGEKESGATKFQFQSADSADLGERPRAISFGGEGEMIATSWLTRMNPRERRLAYAVGGILFLLVNLFIWNALLGMSADARAQYAERRADRAAQEVYVADEKMWQHRADWLKKNQPSSNNPAEASSLLTKVKEIA